MDVTTYNLAEEEKRLLLLLCSEKDFLNHLATSDITGDQWDKFYELSVQHKIAPLIYFLLKKSSSCNYVPENITTRLHKLYIGNSAQNTSIYYHLSSIIKKLNDNNISFILLKGAHLCKLVYGNIGLRFMADIDILFKKKDLQKAQTAIKSIVFHNHRYKPQLDYHWYIEQYLNLDMNGIWRRAQVADIDGQQIRVLSPVDLIIHLCIHFAFHHNFQLGGLRALYDIKLAIDHYSDEIDWDEFLVRSEEWNVRNSVYISLLLSKKLIAANVNRDVLDKLCTPSYNSGKFDWAIHQIFCSADDSQSLSPYFWELFTPGCTRRKIASLTKILFPSPEFISQKYNTINGSACNHLYYFIRFKHQFFKYIKAIALILIRNSQMRETLQNQIKHIEMREWLSSE